MGFMAFTVSENRNGPKTVPCGTHWLISTYVHRLYAINNNFLFPISQETNDPVCNIRVNFNGFQFFTDNVMRHRTDSFLEIKSMILPEHCLHLHLTMHLSQWCKQIINASVVLVSSLYANWFCPTTDLNADAISCLLTTRLKSLMMFVSDMDLKWLHSVKGHSLVKGLTLASFQMRGIHCCSIERLNSLVIIGAKTREKYFHSQYGSPSLTWCCSF